MRVLGSWGSSECPVSDIGVADGAAGLNVAPRAAYARSTTTSSPIPAQRRYLWAPVLHVTDLEADQELQQLVPLLLRMALENRTLVRIYPHPRRARESETLLL